MRALGAFYLRLTGDTMECYNYLEPLYNDYRKLKRMNKNGGKQAPAIGFGLVWFVNIIMLKKSTTVPH